MLTTKEILARLKGLRIALNMRQDEMARRLGVDRTTYVRKERGSIPITTEEWIKLAEAVGKPPSFFFQYDGPAEGKAGDRGTLLAELYRALTPKERCELICAVRLMLKGIRRKTVRGALERLGRA